MRYFPWGADQAYRRAFGRGAEQERPSATRRSWPQAEGWLITMPRTQAVVEPPPSRFFMASVQPSSRIKLRQLDEAHPRADGRLAAIDRNEHYPAGPREADSRSAARAGTTSGLNPSVSPSPPRGRPARAPGRPPTTSVLRRHRRIEVQPELELVPGFSPRRTLWAAPRADSTTPSAVIAPSARSPTRSAPGKWCPGGPVVQPGQRHFVGRGFGPGGGPKRGV